MFFGFRFTEGKRMNRCVLSCLLFVAFVASSAEAQLLPRFRSLQSNCENGQCYSPPLSAPSAGYFASGQRDSDGAVIITSPRFNPSQGCDFGSVWLGPVVQTGVPYTPVVSKQVAVASSLSQVRLTVENVCGSGTAVGADTSGVYILTNAHVAGTRIGRVINVDIDTGSGARQRVQARVVWAAYSDQRLIDAALLKIDAGVVTFPSYIPLSKKQPDSPPYATRGHARCVWPSELKPFGSVEVDPNSPLIKGLPDAIGGQSGSSIYNSRGVTIALLTWSWGGKCAGQQTHWIWKVYGKEVAFHDIPLRPDGLREIADGPTMPCENGIFCEAAEPRTPTENGIFALVDDTIGGAPIWDDGDKPTPEPPGDDGGNGDCHELNDKEWALIQFLRSQQTQAGAFGEFLKTIDWVELFKTVIIIINMFKGM